MTQAKQNAAVPQRGPRERRRVHPPPRFLRSSTLWRAAALAAALPPSTKAMNSLEIYDHRDLGEKLLLMHVI